MKKTFLAITAVSVAAILAYWLLRSPAPTPSDRANRVPDQSQPASASESPAPLAPPPAAGTAPPALSASGSVRVESPGSAFPRSSPHPTAPPALSAPDSILEPISAIPPEMLLENMRTTVRQYGLLYGGNPVGTNPEITKALNGDNPKQIKFLGTDGNRINGKGELVD